MQEEPDVKYWLLSNKKGVDGEKNKMTLKDPNHEATVLIV